MMKSNYVLKRRAFVITLTALLATPAYAQLDEGVVPA